MRLHERRAGGWVGGMDKCWWLAHVGLEIVCSGVRQCLEMNRCEMVRGLP